MYPIFVWTCFSSLLGDYSDMEMPGCGVNACLILVQYAGLFLKMLFHYVPSATQRIPVALCFCLSIVSLNFLHSNAIT